jgi:hypothetical protein
LLLGAAGCGGPADGPSPARSGAAAKVLSIDAKSLPKLASPIAPVDEGRLEVAPPAGWHVPPRSRRWLARFQADPGSPYPMIFVTVEDSDSVFHVTRENLEEFAAQVRKELQADPDTKRLVAGLQPVVIGNFRGTLYRRWGKSGPRVMERWMLETVANGRRYVFEMRSREGLADEYLPHLYAVASRVKFLTGKDSGSALTIIEEAPDDETPEEDAPEEEDDENDAENVDAP